MILMRIKRLYLKFVKQNGEMKLITKYISYKILRNLGAFYASFFILILIIQVMRIQKYIPIYAIDLYKLLKFSILVSPSMFFVAHGIINILALYISYYSFLATSEAIAMRASGYPVIRIALPGIIISSLICIIVMIVGAFIMPQASRMMRKAIVEMKSGYALSGIRSGSINDIGGISIYNSTIRDNLMKNFIIISSQRDSYKESLSVTFSPYSNITSENEGDFLILNNSMTSKIVFDADMNIKDSTTTSSRYSKIKLSSLLDINDESSNTPISIGTMDTLSLIQNAGDNKKYWIEICKRFTIPLYALVANILIMKAIISKTSLRSNDNKKIIKISAVASLILILGFLIPGVVMNGNYLLVKALSSTLIPFSILFVL